MSSKREDHLRAREEDAHKRLEHLERRWSTNPNVYYVLLLIVLLFILLWSWLF